jgi:membrane-bound serine protease (ClpP class)
VTSKLSTILDELGLSNAPVEVLEMGFVQRFLEIISDPNVVMLLFVLGFFGVLAEITTPGIGLPGILGSICLLLSLWGLGVLTLDYAGLALLAIGLLMLGYEIFTPSFGIFGGGGIVALALGLMMVGKEPWIEVAGNVFKGLLIGIVVFLAFAIFHIRRSVRKKPVVGKEELIGEFAIAVSNLSPRGLVRLKGELWSAYCRTGAKKGDELEVKDVKGNVLIVRKRKKAV